MIYLLDTNVCIAILRGKGSVIARLAECRPEDCGVSTITIFELFTGVQKCRHPKNEAPKVHHFLAPLHVLPFDWDSALQAAEVRGKLEKAGQSIGPYDLQLAAQALTLELTLVTHNTREFNRIPDLRVVDWEME